MNRPGAARTALVTAIAGLLALAGALALPTAPASGTGAARWVTGWAASPVAGTEIPWSTCPAGSGLRDQTVRNVVFLSTGGDAVRIRLTNTFGTRAVHIGRTTVAVRSSGADAVPGTMRTLTFGGRPDVTIPAGAQVFSDPTALAVTGLGTLLVSVYVPEATGPVTNHPFTAQGNYLGGGDLTGAVTGGGYGSTPCWMFVDGVDVRAPHRVVGTVVALGDSITDTSATTGDANQRWPDHLARRLVARRGPTLSVANAGLGGNRLLAPRDGEAYYGVPALARLDRDVFAQTGARDVIVHIGVNDIGFDATADEIIAGYRQVVVQTHAQGLRVHGSTIAPFGGSFLDAPARVAVRDAVNAWVRTSGVFDSVVDVDRALADPARPGALRPAYDSGDHLHPNDAGCRAIADAVDLTALLRD
ncbi:SGNH/GDSL hydrolase family protein [Planosporangium sp. 12N6]|uniref:SGNH/GDSL hydrolase family protein n=1 Tax=Planosporangium spinosum TaxID=3402278 RepID=UPI003CF9C772